MHDFLTDQTEVIKVEVPSDGSMVTGHGGGDARLMQQFIAACASGEAFHILSGPAESLETHQIVFAAEEARIRGTVVDVGSQI